MAGSVTSFHPHAHEVRHGDCLEVMRSLEPDSIDAAVTDPPYGISMMGKSWDRVVPGPEYFAEMLRVMKPGAHLLAFGGTRLFHRMACSIEDAGFDIRDCVMWVYGSGFPKSHDVSKAIDKSAGLDTSSDDRWVETPHPVTGAYKTASGNSQQIGQAKPGLRHLYAPATDDAKRWEGWGTALKPAWEPIILARKPFKGTVAANVLEHGTGAINVDGCRVPAKGRPAIEVTGDRSGGVTWRQNGSGGSRSVGVTDEGRWPANVIHDGSDEATAGMGDKARYFYCAKASKKERDAGLEHEPDREKYEAPAGAWGSHNCFSGKDGDAAWKAKHPNLPKKNNHPTVKPVALMRYLVRLVTPPGGCVLDPFAGSGSTGVACVHERFGFLGVEQGEDYCRVARQRIVSQREGGGLYDGGDDAMH